MIMDDPGKTLRAHLMGEISKGRRYFKAKHLAKDLGMSPKEIGTRLGLMEKFGARGIRVTKWADRVWRVEICNECKKIRGDTRPV